MASDSNTSVAKLNLHTNNLKYAGNKKLTILIVGSTEVCETLFPILLEQALQMYDGGISICRTEKIIDVIESDNPDKLIDFVVLIAKEASNHELTFLKNNIKRLESSFVNSRCCIVNGNSSSAMANAEKLTSLADLYLLPYLCGKISDPVACEHLCRRILLVATTVCGFRQGIPQLIPTPDILNHD